MRSSLMSKKLKNLTKGFRQSRMRKSLLNVVEAAVPEAEAKGSAAQKSPFATPAPITTEGLGGGDAARPTISTLGRDQSPIGGALETPKASPKRGALQKQVSFRDGDAETTKTFKPFAPEPPGVGGETTPTKSPRLMMRKAKSTVMADLLDEAEQEMKARRRGSLRRSSSDLGRRGSGDSFVAAMNAQLEGVAKEEASKEQDAGDEVPDAMKLDKAGEKSTSVEAIIFIPRFQCVVSAAADGFLRFWNLHTGELYMVTNSHHPEGHPVRDMALRDPEDHHSSDAAEGVDNSPSRMRRSKAKTYDKTKPALLITACAGGYVKLWEIRHADHKISAKKLYGCDYMLIDRRLSLIQTNRVSPRHSAGGSRLGSVSSSIGSQRNSLSLARKISKAGPHQRKPNAAGHGYSHAHGHRPKTSTRPIALLESSESESDEEDDSPRYHSLMVRRMWQAHGAAITSVAFISSYNRHTMYQKPERKNVFAGRQQQVRLRFGGVLEAGGAAAARIKKSGGAEPPKTLGPSAQSPLRARRGNLFPGRDAPRAGKGSLFKSNLSEEEEEGYHCAVLGAEEQSVMVLTASVDANVVLWTILGVKIGVFGQEDPWDLFATSTWLMTKPIERTQVFSARGERVTMGVLIAGVPSKPDDEDMGFGGDETRNRRDKAAEMALERRAGCLRRPQHFEADPVLLAQRRHNKVNKAKKQFYDTGKGKGGHRRGRHKNHREQEQVQLLAAVTDDNLALNNYRNVLLRHRFDNVYQQLGVYDLSRVKAPDKSAPRSQSARYRSVTELL
mmetsp:Transcript_13797/g.40898  ORF Transcript_13797/g.40898 Transcript_13797/m.40898 type:complete len:785 (+) Transcript_13797:1730-4084(+)